MHRRINPHRRFVGVFRRNFLVDIEKISVALANGLFAQTRNSVGKIEINPASPRSDTMSFIAHFLGRARSDVARREISEAWIFSLKIIIAVRIRNIFRRFGAIFSSLWHPNASVIAQRFRHQSQFGLMLTGDGDAGGMNLSEARITKKRTAFVSAIGGGDVATARVGRKKKDIAVTAGRENNGIAGEGIDFAGAQVAGDDSLGMTIDQNEVEHLGLREHFHRAEGDFPAEGLIGPEQQLLAGLAAGVKRPRNLRPAEGTIGEQPAILARERYTLFGALVDDEIADFGQPVNVRFARTEIAPFDRVVKQSENAVAVVLVILGSIDPALRRNGMGATRRILITKTFHTITKFTQSGRGRSASQPRTDHNDFKFAAIIRANETRIILVVPPFLLEWTGRNFAVEFSDHNCCAGWMRPSKTATGMAV